MRFFEKAKGSISIFLILVLVPMYTCVYLAIDSARYSAAKAKVEGTLELTENSALAGYDRTFKELYGLFAMSSSDSDLQENLIVYFSNMIDSSEVENTIRTFPDAFEIEFDDDRSVISPDALDESIKNFMKYRAPYEWSKNLSQKIEVLSKVGTLSSKVEDGEEEIKSQAEGSKYATETISESDAKAMKSGLEEIGNTDLASFNNGDNIEIASLISKNIYEMIGSTSKDSLSANDIKGIKNIALNCYEAEYILGMFGCLTTKESDHNLMDVTFENHPMLSSEVEYIIFGQNTTKENISSALNLIFAIRLLFNSIYVYSSASMQESALAAATAIAGWTGVGIPVIQNAILIAWATAETTLDVASLCKGKTVPLYKTASTWTLGLSGVTRTLAGGAASYASKEIDDVFKKIEDASVEKTEDIKDAALSYMNQTGQSAAQTLTNTVVTAVQNKINTITSKTDVTYTKEEIEGLLRKAVNSIPNSSKGIETAKTLFNKYCLLTLTDKIYENLPDFVTDDEAISKAAGEKISNAISSAYSTLYSKVEASVNSIAEKAEGSLQKAIGSASDKVKDNTIEVINSYADEIGKYLGDDTASTVSKSSGIGMTYEDYLKLFVMVLLSSDKKKTNVLKRTATVMQINCAKRDSQFDITKRYFGATVSTSVTVSNHKIKMKEEFGY